MMKKIFFVVIFLIFISIACNLFYYFFSPIIGAKWTSAIIITVALVQGYILADRM